MPEKKYLEINISESIKKFNYIVKLLVQFMEIFNPNVVTIVRAISNKNILGMLHYETYVYG